MNLGLRCDYESAKTQALIPLTGEPGPGITRDKNNISPRLGVAWSPGGNTRQVIYGGSGIYYDQVILNIIGNARFTPWNWNSQIGYRRELASDIGLDVSFVYNRGYDHIGITNTNLAAPGCWWT